MRIGLLPLFFVLSISAFSQRHGFAFGSVSPAELEMKIYSRDTTANAVVLNEFGEAYIDPETFNLFFEYHVKIKILKQEGAALADIQIPLYRNNGKDEKLRTSVASSFNLEGGKVSETKLEWRQVYNQNFNEHFQVVKFAIPNVHAGSVIEYSYELESPYIFNFRPWTFQSDIPKVKSEYWATIPGNYTYNTTLKGFLKLSKNESDLIPQCLRSGTASADCARYKFGMVDVPALRDEEYMTTRSNFLAAINFELSEIKHFDGRVDRVTKEWKDADEELRKHTDFGVQLKRGERLLDEHFNSSVVNPGEDALRKAQTIFEFVRGWYEFTGDRGKYSESGVKKAFENKKGNVGDINLTLISALRSAGLLVDPVILSTRDNGLPIELHPVLSDFNYVVARLVIGETAYLLDATDDFVPFGVLPKHCLNGKGRVLGDQGSYWIDLKPAAKTRRVSVLNLSVTGDGHLSGDISTTYFGYAAIDRRREIAASGSSENFLNELKSKMSDVTVENFSLANLDSTSLPLTEKMEVESELQGGNFLMLNPFIVGRWTNNPFKSSERLYPVDFATAVEESTVISINYPEGFEIEGLPDQQALSLPGNGGKFILRAQDDGRKVQMSNMLALSRTLYSSQEYFALRELFARMIQAHGATLILKKKT